MDKKRILIIEDDALFRRTLADYLDGCGYETTLAADGVQGLEMARAEQFDVALVDLRIPRMSGLQVIAILSAEQPTLPIIVVSGNSLVGNAIEAMRRGAWDYITKPILDNDELLDCIERHLALRELEYQEINQDSQEIEENKAFLIKEIKLSRMRQVDLQRQLQECREQSRDVVDRQFPAEFDQLIGEIAHDMRNGLGIIHNTVGFLEDSLADTSYQPDLSAISDSVDFCELVLRNLSILGGYDVFDPRWVNLEIIVRKICLMLERKLVNIDLMVDADPSAPEILADEGQMKQAFMNLIKNAGEAMPDGGILTVRTRREEQMLCIEVSDTGYGISTENQDRIFRESFTTKKQGHGLGLHIVHTIVNRHGGTIEVESEVGKGTTFTLRLPIEPE